MPFLKSALKMYEALLDVYRYVKIIVIKYSIIILLYSFSIDINMRKNCVRIIIKCKRYCN